MGPAGTEDASRRVAARRLLLVGGLQLAGMLALSLWARSEIPAGQDVVLHRGLEGEPDRLGDVAALLWLLPAVTLPILAVLVGAVRAGGIGMWEPSSARGPRTEPLLQAWFGIGVIGFMAALHAVFLLDAVGRIGDPVRVVLGVIAAFSAAFGWALLSTRAGEAMLQMGVNLPRPSAPAARRRLRRVVGIGFVATGAVTAVSTLNLPVAVPTVALLGGLVASCLAGLVVSVRARAAERSP